MGLLTFC